MLAKFFAMGADGHEGDFEGWYEIPSVFNAIMNFYNKKLVDGKRYLQIMPMRKFKAYEQSHEEVKDYPHISQSVMSFREYEIEKGTMGEWDDTDDTDEYARIGFPDDTMNPVAISMSKNDCTYWIIFNTTDTGNGVEAANQITELMSDDELAKMIDDIREYMSTYSGNM